MKRFFLIFSLLLLVAGAVFVALPVGEAADIYDGVVRLHILAVSDEEQDQANKLQVRDAILEAYSEDLNGLTSREEAETYLTGHLSDIEALATAKLSELGCEEKATVTLTNEYYPTREYESMRLPAGNYLSLRVILGEGKGKNWWCMIYPPLCTSSSRADEELVEAGFSKNQVRLLTDSEDGGTVVKFKIVETFSSLWQKVKGWFQ